MHATRLSLCSQIPLSLPSEALECSVQVTAPVGTQLEPGPVQVRKQRGASRVPVARTPPSPWLTLCFQ